MVPFVREAVGVSELGVFQSEFPPVLVHFFHKSTDWVIVTLVHYLDLFLYFDDSLLFVLFLFVEAFSKAFSQSQSGIVPTGQHQSIEQIQHFESLVGKQLRACSKYAARFWRDSEVGVVDVDAQLFGKVD